MQRVAQTWRHKIGQRLLQLLVVETVEIETQFAVWAKPREHPTDTRHVVDDPDVLLIHVTAFNELMWDSGRTPTRVIEHGVTVPDDVGYVGDLERGIVVVNNLAGRGRRLGADVFERARAEVPLDLVGLGADALGGLGEVKRRDLPAFEANYRFFFHPVRYTSFGMAVCEAMMIGLPVVSLATTEMPTVIEDGVSGFVSTGPVRLFQDMRELIHQSLETWGPVVEAANIRVE